VVIKLGLLVVGRCFRLACDLECPRRLVELQVKRAELLVLRQVTKNHVLLILRQVRLHNVVQAYDLDSHTTGDALDDENHRDTDDDDHGEVIDREVLVDRNLELIYFLVSLQFKSRFFMEEENELVLSSVIVD